MYWQSRQPIRRIIMAQAWNNAFNAISLFFSTISKLMSAADQLADIANETAATYADEVKSNRLKQAKALAKT